MANTPRIDASFEPCWLTWVGAVTGCLKALGVACDTADVAGHSGYAFRIGVHKELCPSGPTVFDWGTLTPGIWRLGRSTVLFQGPECHTKGWINDRTRAHSRAAFDYARQELAAGRPCVIWGAYIPEFAIALGADEEHYRVDSCRKFMGQEQAPIRWDSLEAPGGLYVLGFPTATRTPDAGSDREAVKHALRALGEVAARDDYAWGLMAYDLWAEAIRDNRLGHRFGVGYNAACWAEARKLAHTFVARLAARHDTPARPMLEEAATALGRAADALAAVARVFPFPGGKPGEDQAALEPLAKARAADADATSALTRALAAWPRVQRTPGS